MYQSERGLPTSNWHHAASLASAQTRAESRSVLGSRHIQGFGTGDKQSIPLEKGITFLHYFPSTSWLSSLQFFVWGRCGMCPMWASPAVWGAYLRKPTIPLQGLWSRDALDPMPGTWRCFLPRAGCQGNVLEKAVHRWSPIGGPFSSVCDTPCHGRYK